MVQRLRHAITECAPPLLLLSRLTASTVGDATRVVLLICTIYETVVSTNALPLRLVLPKSACQCNPNTCTTTQLTALTLLQWGSPYCAGPIAPVAPIAPVKSLRATGTLYIGINTSISTIPNTIPKSARVPYPAGIAGWDNIPALYGRSHTALPLQQNVHRSPPTGNIDSMVVLPYDTAVYLALHCTSFLLQEGSLYNAGCLLWSL